MRRKPSKSYSTGMIVLLFLCAMYIVVYPAFQKQESAQNESSESGIVDTFSDSEETSENDVTDGVSVSDDEDDAVTQAIQAIEEKSENEVSGSDLSQADSSEDGTQADAVYYEFRDDGKFQGHYEKHGIEMGFSSPEEYLAAANALINNPEALHKYEEEDGDDVYFLESTNEIAFVSADGYIRTYFICSGKDYFDRQ